MADRPDIPLNALRAFEVAARQGSFTRAAVELRVTQAAVSHQIARLEELIGATLFLRTPAGLTLTEEAQIIFPVLERSLNDIGRALDRVSGQRQVEVLNLGVVTTFAAGWLIPRLASFERQFPEIVLRISTHNNRVEIAREGLDLAVRFGNGRWPGLEALPIMPVPMSPLCTPEVAAQLTGPEDLPKQRLLRSYRSDEWTQWFGEAGVAGPAPTGPVFDSSIAMADLAARGHGIALLPLPMFEADLASARLVQPFDTTVTLGGYWLTIPADRNLNPAMRALLDWMRKEAGRPAGLARQAP
ncbi:LysR family transcriptional regulator [Falsirhodobacter deserti]|uniref:LysR family transcriptional regulator n=1 Tax=Falsirhodobacter deserti TaxID=1365611 RepID=UPI000FE351DB|nr:LysR family transcriptional regulator [Falsirhodobacter deserti]